MKQIKLGHQVPKGWKVNRFNKIEIRGDLHYCISHNFKGYSNGCDNILWDNYGEFNKWSQCYKISKATSNNDIIKILTS